MALFGILRGNSTGLDKKPFHDGYCYYEIDTGKFWIDALDGSKEIRRCINDGGSGIAIQKTLEHGTWTIGSVYNLSVPEVKADSNGVVGVAQEATTDQYNAAKDAAIRLTNQGNGTLQFVATAGNPDKDIPITIVIFK